MILIGQFDSPFVRRVGIALTQYGMAFQHRPWSTFGDGDKISPLNPLRRAPTLVLDRGETLIESWAILDAIDELAGPAKALAPASGPERRQVLKVAALGCGMADKAVALVYERALHQTTSDVWLERCRGQIGAVLDVLEAARAARSDPWWFGAAITHADIAVTCALTFLAEAHPEAFDLATWPALQAHAARSEALPVFQAVRQKFVSPA